MLSASPQQQADTMLDLRTDNWSIFSQSFTQLCFTKFGVAGQQILSDHVIPLEPFATAPSKKALDIDADGLPIDDQFVYSRRRYTLDEAALPNFSLTSLPLSDSGNREYREDLKIFKAAARRSFDDDTECLACLYKHISATSHTSIKTHVNYAALVNAVIHSTK